VKDNSSYKMVTMVVVADSNKDMVVDIGNSHFALLCKVNMSVVEEDNMEVDNTVEP
jgi:hypothetical protein